MSQYDLHSLNLPKLNGKLLSLFTAVATSPITQPLLLGSLLENGGIPKLRKMVFTESPTYFPLVNPSQHAGDSTESSHYLTMGNRTSRDLMPFTTIQDYALAYRQGTLTPFQAAEKIIQAITESDHTDPPMHAFTASLKDDVMKQAGISTTRLQTGQSRSLLEGVPVAIKEELDLVPYPTTVGTSFMGRQPAQRDSFLVARLRTSGALLVGKTNMREIGIAANGENIHHGRIANPYNLHHDPGGSSSGSGAAVAAGIVPVAIGADGGGSIRVPASLCGVVGLKPTFGRVSEAGAAPLCWSVAHNGPLGASVGDVALVYQIIAGPDPEESLTHRQPPVTVEGWNRPDLKGIRLGIYPEWFRHADPEVVAVNEKMVAELVKAGGEVIEITVPELDAMRIAHVVSILAEMAASMKNYPDHWKDFSPSTRLGLVVGQVMSAYDYIQAQRMRTRALRIFADIYHEVDIIITPTTALTAPKAPSLAQDISWSDMSNDTEMMRFMFPGNLTGLPAISFPVGYNTEGLPIGMQAMGRHWEEHLLLRVAYNAEVRMERILPKAYFADKIESMVNLSTD
jgi:Asp-tRNA(Asn)/Glu-tRNA(Gln) amidotransferase A subunit family amidase